MRNELTNFLSTLPDIRGKRIYVWGTGNTTELYQEGFARIPDFRIEAYIDNNPARQGKIMFGAPVLAPADVPRTDDMMILVCTGQPAAWAGISKQISGMGLPFCFIDAGIFGLYKDEILTVFDALDDDRSRAVYLNVLMTRADCRLPDEDIVCGDQYFAVPAFAGRNPSEVFLDCGAFVGDSVEQYLWKHEGVFGKIICFEPDTANFAAMQYRMERLKREWNIPDSKLEMYPYAVGAEEETSVLSQNTANNGLGSKLVKADGQTDGIICRTVPLTPYISEHSIIKADIESYEYQMLAGAADAIRQYRPKISVCIYHNAVDLVSIPMLLYRLNPQYRLRVRQHAHQIAETVLYAY